MSTFEVTTTVFPWYGDRQYQGIYEIEVKQMETRIFTQVRAPYLAELYLSFLIQNFFYIRGMILYKTWYMCSQDGPLKDVRYEDDMKPYPFGLYVDNLSPNPSSSTPFH
ncbi:hypothetical protein [Oryza sativa Japonica Group]|uniref:Uncharacterized protein n=1 Tax=Oryza sativa subsp. japonica TaxID=39947 RepID=Q5JNI9_ORYSJ|nr:hypothetical protein [Oryza sativa Japonica Group]